MSSKGRTVPPAWDMTQVTREQFGMLSSDPEIIALIQGHNKRASEVLTADEYALYCKRVEEAKPAGLECDKYRQNGICLAVISAG